MSPMRMDLQIPIQTVLTPLTSKASIGWLLITTSVQTTIPVPVVALAMAGQAVCLLTTPFRLVIQARPLMIKPTNFQQIATLVIPPVFIRELIRADLVLWRTRVLI